MWSCFSWQWCSNCHKEWCWCIFCRADWITLTRVYYWKCLFGGKRFIFVLFIALLMPKNPVFLICVITFYAPITQSCSAAVTSLCTDVAQHHMMCKCALVFQFILSCISMLLRFKFSSKMFTAMFSGHWCHLTVLHFAFMSQHVFMFQTKLQCIRKMFLFSTRLLTSLASSMLRPNSVCAALVALGRLD